MIHPVCRKDLTKSFMFTALAKILTGLQGVYGRNSRFLYLRLRSSLISQFGSVRKMSMDSRKSWNQMLTAVAIGLWLRRSDHREPRHATNAGSPYNGT